MIWRILQICRAPLAAIFLSSLSALVAAQGAGSWGGATGIAGAAIAIVVVGYLFCSWVVWLVVKAIGAKVGANSAIRLIVTILISSAPLAYCEKQSQERKNIRAVQESADYEFRVLAKQYIAEKCPTERRVTPSTSIPADTGVYLADVKDFNSLGLTDVPTTQPLSVERKRNHDRYGTRYPDETDIDGQFNQLLQWTTTKNPFAILSQGAAFVEFVEQHGPDMGQKFRVAHYKWWAKNATPTELERTLKRYEGHKYLDQDNPILTSPVEELKATYELAKRDVSTLEDRKHWVARAQMSFTKRSEKSLVAEYVGLAATHTWMPIDGSRWTRVTVCNGAETQFFGGFFNWEPERFFFSEVVRFKQ